LFFPSVSQRKRKAKLKSDGRVNGVDPLAEDDDDRLKEIARQFEEKYVSTYMYGGEQLTIPLTLYIHWFKHELLLLQEVSEEKLNEY
jgi:hypothetical protein